MLELAFVRGAVKVAFRLCDEPVVVDLPEVRHRTYSAPTDAEGAHRSRIGMRLSFH